MTEWMIKAEGLSKEFDSFLAVDNVSFDVKKGQILVLLGPNGAGKTTTVRMLTSILRPTRGSATVAGFDVVDQPDKVRASVGVLTEHHGLYTRMNAHEYLGFFSQLYGIPKPISRERNANLLNQFGLGNVGKKRLGEYSKGMRQKLALVRALLHEPQVILLDEPTSAMDPESAYIVRDAIRELKNTERSIILCTHNLKEAEELADRIAIIKSGKIILNGNLAEFRTTIAGNPVFEIRFSEQVTGAIEFPFTEVDHIVQGENWLRYSCSDPDRVNPMLLKFLQEKGVSVRTLEEVRVSLEDVYLRTVGNKEED